VGVGEDLFSALRLWKAGRVGRFFSYSGLYLCSRFLAPSCFHSRSDGARTGSGRMVVESGKEDDREGVRNVKSPPIFQQQACECKEFFQVYCVY
jgi:hypothetical protein